MTIDGAVELFKNAIFVAAMIAGPALAVALVMGLIVGVLQAATQVNEASISFVAKLIAVRAAMGGGKKKARGVGRKAKAVAEAVSVPEAEKPKAPEKKKKPRKSKKAEAQT